MFFEKKRGVGEGLAKPKLNIPEFDHTLKKLYIKFTTIKLSHRNIPMVWIVIFKRKVLGIIL
jgi:hypothetical protein